MAQHFFEATETQVLIDAPIIAVRRDMVRMPDGKVVPREVVEHFGAVAVVAARPNAAAAGGYEIAMIRQYRRAVDRRMWELPAGLLDAAGENEVAAARRELQEEAGLAAARWAVLVDLVTSSGFCDEAVRVFLAEDLSEVPRPEPEEEEIELEVSWVPIHAARDMVHSGEIVSAITIAAVMTAARVLAREAQPREVGEEFALRPTALAQRRIDAGAKPGEDMKRWGGSAAQPDEAAR